ncbi:dedicator of cytokinesis protein 9-like isoform X3 [Styela clava]
MSAGTRKFAKGLNRPGTASKRRESATQAVRESMYSSVGSELLKSTLTEPIDYEAFLLKRQSEIINDSHRNLLEFPTDDYEATQQTQDRRTEIDSVPDGAEKEASSLMVKECIKTYQNSWHLIKHKYEEYAGSYLQLPDHGLKPPPLKEVVYEVDEEADFEEDNLQILHKEGVTKRGWLYKAPSYTGSSISIRSFKRRYFDLKQMPDSSYILNYYKDEKTSRDPKGAIYLDSCIGAHSVSWTTKGRKYAFEIRMQDQSCHLLAAETEHEANEWIGTINHALQNAIEAQLQNEEQSKIAQQEIESKSGGTMESLQSSMHPELVKYSKETDQKNATARKDGRLNLVHIYPEFQEKYLKVQRSAESMLPPPPVKHHKHRVLVQCKTISFNLRGVVIDGAEEPKTSVEPFFVTLCLYDVAQMKKISADVHVDLNHDLVRKMIPERELSSRKASSPSGSIRTTSDIDESKTGEPILNMIKKQWIAHPKNCVFNVSKPHPDIYLVVRIEKVLQGSIKSCTQPYMKSDGDINKTAMKVLKHAKVACQRLGQYRMPFAWTAKPLFCDSEGTLEDAEFMDVFKQESSKLGEENLLKYLTDFRKPEKLKLEYIECNLVADFHRVPSDVTSLLSPSLVPVKPYDEKSEPILEVDEFLPTSLSDQNMNMEYVNHFYIYPRSLKYDSQKSFPKARNIAVVIEFRESDAEGSTPLRSFYNRPGSEVFAKRVSAAVLHHNETPEFYEEFKLALPPQLHSGHHLLFSFYHIFVDMSGKKKDATRIEIGHAWLPLLTKDGQVWCNEQTLPVSMNLPPGYLSQDLNLSGRGQQHAGPELKWVDGGKLLFRLSTRLVSSVYTTDPHIHNFFDSCQRSLTGNATDHDVVKYLKTLLAADDKPLIQFLPTMLNQLLKLLASPKSTREVKSNCIKSLVHIVTICHKSENHKDLLKQYIKYMFVTEPWPDYQTPTVHEELVINMTELLRPSVTDFLTMNKLLRHLSFFLEIVVKSMAQHLIMAQKIKQRRNERFPVSFQHAIQSLLTTTVPHIVGKWKTNYDEVCNANLSIAQFVKNCFTYVDRGFVFKLINHYLVNFNANDPKVLFEFKFEFLRVVCNHEHYIPLNLPFAANVKRNKTADSWWITQKSSFGPIERDYNYSLSEDYCKNHFLAGHLLQSLNAAMYEPSEIRSIAIETLKNVLAKHAFDPRYNTPGHQARIAALYLPFLRIVLDNAGRFSLENDGSYSSRDDLDNTPSKFNDSAISGSYSPKIDRINGSLRMGRNPADANMLSAIANPGLLGKDSRASLAVNESQATAALDRVVERNLSLTSATRLLGTERFDISESRSLLLCFLQVLKNIPPDALKGFWLQSTTDEQIEFFDLIEVCMYQFRYTGKRQQIQNISKALTMPARIRPGTSHQYKHISILAEPMVAQSGRLIDEQDAAHNSMLEANLASEVGMIILDVLGDFTRHFKKYLQNKEGDNPLMQRLSSVFLLFLQISQSEYVLKHAFASLRLFMCKFQPALFRGKADLCASLIYYALKCCNSRLASTRSEACALLYLLMRTNFEFSGRNFVRSHLQMIKAVSQLISEEVGIGNSRFQNSLSVINAYAQSDKGMQRTALKILKQSAITGDSKRQHSVFHIEVKDLTKRIRTVLMATAAMKEHKDDPEMLVDLQDSLAKSYAATPELRKTWLESMARVHEKHGNFSEAAMCYIHIAALVAEYLKRKDMTDRAKVASSKAMRNLPTNGPATQNNQSGFISRFFPGGSTPNPTPENETSQESGDHSFNTMFIVDCKSLISKGCSAFRTISPNVEKEESAIKEDTGMQDVQYNEDVLTELLRRCVSVLQTAERYELMASVFRMIIPFYEKNRDYMGLVEIYGTLKDSYAKIVQVNASGKRMLGTYFRVAFYGQQYFDEEDGREYIYKEPKLTQLSEISMRLQHMYGTKFGHENIKLIQESNKVNRKDLDPKFAYIQVTYVQPYFDEQEIEHRKNYFERAHNLRNFVFETPFTPGGKARGGIEEQWKRKTILSTAHSFPYIKKRIMVTSQRSFELKPIEVALDEMVNKCAELEELVLAPNIDLKKLQLRLQGSVSVQVNAGPLAYAKAFLEDAKVSCHPANTVERLRKIFRKFVGLCGQALDINEQLISSDQHDYHENLRECFHGMAAELSQILHEQLMGDDDDTTSLTASSVGEAESVFTSISSPKTNFPNLQGSVKYTSAANLRPASVASAGSITKRNLQGAVSDSSQV